jgi:hypothetical protein
LSFKNYEQQVMQLCVRRLLWTRQLSPRGSLAIYRHDMNENGWPALLAALSFMISPNLSDDFFVDVLAHYRALINTLGMLSLPTPHESFFASLAKFLIPTARG